MCKHLSSTLSEYLRLVAEKYLSPFLEFGRCIGFVIGVFLAYGFGLSPFIISVVLMHTYYQSCNDENRKECAPAAVAIVLGSAIINILLWLVPWFVIACRRSRIAPDPLRVIIVQPTKQ